MRQIFLGWGQGSSWGSPFAELFAGLKPIPMIHIGTDDRRARTEAITPARIAAGRGDALSRRAQPGDRRLRRPGLRAGDGRDEQPEESLLADAAQRQLEGRLAFAGGVQAGVPARAYLILHGGEVDAKLRRLGQPPVDGELDVNAAPALTVIWNPIAGLDARSARPGADLLPR